MQLFGSDFTPQKAMKANHFLENFYIFYLNGYFVKTPNFVSYLSFIKIIFFCFHLLFMCHHLRVKAQRCLWIWRGWLPRYEGWVISCSHLYHSITNITNNCATFFYVLMITDVLLWMHCFSWSLITLWLNTEIELSVELLHGLYIVERF